MKISNQELAQLIGQRETQHPSADELAAMMDRSLPLAEQEALLEHLERCAQCSQAVAITLEPTSRLAAPVAVTWLPRAMAAAIALAAVALASMLFMGTDHPDDVLRAADTTLSPPPGAEVPAGATEFSWPAPDDLSLRRVRLMNESATTLWVSDLSQPPVTMPPQHIRSNTTFLWQLEDTTGNVMAGPHWFRIQ